MPPAATGWREAKRDGEEELAVQAALSNAINACVQENVNALLQLIDILHEWVSPTSLKS
jgi:hypothetical protein